MKLILNGFSPSSVSKIKERSKKWFLIILTEKTARTTLAPKRQSSVSLPKLAPAKPIYPILISMRSQRPTAPKTAAVPTAAVTAPPVRRDQWDPKVRKAALVPAAFLVPSDRSARRAFPVLLVLPVPAALLVPQDPLAQRVQPA